MARIARWGCGFAAAAFTLASVWSGSAAAAASNPVGVVRSYLAALAAHDAGGVCRTFSPQLRAFEARWEAGALRSGCAGRVSAAHFSPASPGQAVTRIDIARVLAVRRDHLGTAAVHLVLFFRFPCVGAVSVIPGCRPHFERRGDVIYLRREHGHWLIVKPGAVYENTSSDAAPFGFDPFTPPATASAASRVARLPALPLLCPPGGVSASDPINDLTSSSGRPSRIHAPWLDITAVSVVRTARQSLCVTITLAARPRADSSYAIDVDQPQGGGETADTYLLEIDGNGRIHPRLGDPVALYGRGRRACPTGYGLNGNQLELIVSPGDSVFRNTAPIRLDASTSSLQPGEPLIRHPIDATDIAPSFLGLTLPAVTSPELPRCGS